MWEDLEFRATRVLHNQTKEAEAKEEETNTGHRGPEAGEPSDNSRPRSLR